MSEALLLDTHALLWALYSPGRLSSVVRTALEDVSTAVHASAVSAYEIALKHARGQLDFAAPLAADFLREIAVPGFESLAVKVHHAQRAGALAMAHKDPWDRLLIAQAQSEGMVLVSNERLFDSLDVSRLW